MRPSAALLLCLTAALSAAAAPGPFSSAGLQGWVEQTFKDVPPVHYRLTRGGGVQVLEAKCRAGASGWLWRETVDLRRKPALIVVCPWSVLKYSNTGLLEHWIETTIHGRLNPSLVR